MIVTAWNNGKHNKSGYGYGLRIGTINRDKFFKKNWKIVTLSLEGYSKNVEVKITPGFWNKCSEIRNREIGLWFQQLKCTTWPKDKPPEFIMEVKSERFFSVRKF